VCATQEGLIAERGTHAQLIQQGGLYAEMWTRQAEAAAVEEVGGSGERTPDGERVAEVDAASTNGSGHGQEQF
jgi:hypothetical protein